MERKQMKKSMADAAFALKNGGISQVIDEETSFIIIYCEAKKLGDATPLEKVRPDIERVIDQQKSKESLDKWLADLRRKAVIKKMDTGTVEQPVVPRAAVVNELIYSEGNRLAVELAVEPVSDRFSVFFNRLPTLMSWQPEVRRAHLMQSQ
jgi:PPIC-type PPIASE domain